MDKNDAAKVREERIAGTIEAAHFAAFIEELVRDRHDLAAALLDEHCSIGAPPEAIALADSIVDGTDRDEV